MEAFFNWWSSLDGVQLVGVAIACFAGWLLIDKALGAIQPAHCGVPFEIDRLPHHCEVHCEVFRTNDHALVNIYATNEKGENSEYLPMIRLNKNNLPKRVELKWADFKWSRENDQPGSMH